MFHPLVRKHLQPFAKRCYPLPSYMPGSDIAYLNFNINSYSSNPYKFYPNLGDTTVATKFIQVLQAQVKEENIFFSQGSAGAIDLIIRSFCEPGIDSIVVTSPTFLYYSYRATLENVGTIDVPLLGENYDQLNVHGINQQQGKVLFLCTPNNPVGTCLQPDQIETILLNFKGLVVVDEAYIEWTKRASFVSQINKYENLIVLRTFSKIWGLAGARCGAVIAPASIINVLKLTQTMFGLPESSAKVLLSQMDKSEELLEDREQMISLKEDLTRFLEPLNFVKKVYPGEANFLLVAFVDAKRVAAHLQEKKILVQDTTNQVRNTLRISMGTKNEMEQLKVALAKL